MEYGCHQRVSHQLVQGGAFGQGAAFLQRFPDKNQHDKLDGLNKIAACDT